MRTGRISRALASPRLGTALMLIWLLLLVVWVVPFHFYGLPMERIRAIVADEPFFQAVYALVLVSTIACIVPRVQRVLRRVTATPSVDAAPSIAVRGTPVSEFTYTRETALEALEDARFGRVVTGEGWAWGVRRPYGPLGNLLFHLSFIALAVALAVAAFVPGFSGSAIVSEGERFTGTLAEYQSVDVSADATAPVPPDVSFEVQSIDARFFEDVLLFTDLEAAILTPAGTTRRIGVGRPWMTGATGLVQLEDFGYSLELVDRFDEANPVESAYKLNAFPSGLVDTFEYKDLTPGSNDVYQVSVAVYGDYVEGSDPPNVASYNLADPWVDITIGRKLSTGEVRTLFDGVVPVGTTVELPSGELEIVGVSEWGRFRVIESPSAPLFALALVAALAGVILRLLFPRTEALIASSEDGSATVSVRQDVYGTSARDARRLAEMLGSGGEE